VILRDGRLREFYVTAAPGGDFQWTIDVPSTLRLAEYLEVGGIQLEEGQVTEINLEVEDWLRKVSAVLEAGYLVTVDYGANADDLYSQALRPHGSLRSFQRHQIVEDILARPGEQDLTTTVDWTYVKRITETLGFETVEFERQDKFLIAAGLLDQLELESGRTGSAAEKLRLSTAAREMILPDGMGAHFQVLVQKKAQLRSRVV
jgi:SAM-dependent MidA family methyltransferase